MKNRPLGNGLFHSDGQTDITKLIFAFPSFANARWEWNSHFMILFRWNLFLSVL